MGLENQGAKPSGLTGKIIGRLMNRFQTSLYIDYFSDKMPADHSKILDIGCGGGKFLKFLADSNDSYNLYGIDHSPEMTALSLKTNQKAIKQKRLQIFQGTVADIPIENASLDLVTALETVQFWPDTEQSFSEVHRVLKKGGEFVIINRYPDEGTKWWKIAAIKSDKEYIRFLKNAGFEQITVDLNFKKPWIVVTAIKM